ncbi:Uncharacterized protein APZ42_022708 [Daphnia magna]|uniref:Uncharacterized protein n=1 Tax=Daphnia magna TaxID=35525 RepID=A0A164VQU6_9CRUS|nr:Uncharacterized protein APZ42_022708 [Daphnia magna]
MMTSCHLVPASLVAILVLVVVVSCQERIRTAIASPIISAQQARVLVLRTVM